MVFDHPETQRRDAIRRLVCESQDVNSLVEAALLMACEEYPHLDVAACHERLEALGRRYAAATQAQGGGRGDALAALHRILFDEEGLRGNASDYYDPRNSFLNDVLERRTGIPITLSLVYMFVASRGGLRTSGVGLPGHFLVRVEDGREPLWVDPFRRGHLLQEDDCRRLVEEHFGERLPWRREYLSPCRSDQVMVRILNNLKGIYLRQPDFDRALWVQDLLVRLAPDDPREYRDRGLVHAQLQNYAHARRDLQAYLERCSQAPPDADAIAADLERLRRLQLMRN